MAVMQAVLRNLPGMLLLVALAACTGALSTTQSISPVEQQPQGFAVWNSAPPVYRFGAGDHVRVEFLLTPEMNEDVVVGPDGYIGLRAAGRVPAIGQSADALQADIAKASRRFLVDPIVTVSVIDPTAAAIYVGGSVRTPGAFQLRGRMGTLEGILLAGGFDTEARYDEVVLIRRSPQDKPMLRTVNLQGFISHGATPGDVPLFPGDIIFVPRNRISEVDEWVDQFLNKSLPFNKDFTYTLGRYATTTGGGGIFP